MRVLVIGAGIGGLCLAQGLLGAGHEVHIYEKDAACDSRYQGFRISLDASGAQSLRECLPRRLLPLLEATTAELSGDRRVVDDQLRVLGDLGPARPGLAADRQVLRHLLMAGLTKHVEFGKQLTGYHETADGGVLACFTDGSSIAGDLLVGADGVGSAVRRQLLPHAEVVRLRGESLLGRTPLTERFRHLVPGYGTMVRGPRARMLLGKMEFRIPPHIAARESSATADLPETGDYVRWVVFLNGQEGPVPGVWPEARSLILKAVASWHPDLRALVEHSDHVNSSALTTSFAKPVPRWKTRPITLLGDAIHVMPPSGGQGANTALRDAALLCRVLCSAPGGRVGLLEAVETYERLMLDYGFAAVAKSLDEASMPRR